MVLGVELRVDTFATVCACYILSSRYYSKHFELSHFIFITTLWWSERNGPHKE